MVTPKPRRLALLAVLLLGACAAPPPPPVQTLAEVARPAPPPVEVLARNEDFIVVLPKPDDDFASLAKRYLGDARRAWWIADFNGVSQPQPGVDLVIPLKASSLNSVDGSGVRTLAVLTYHRFGSARSKMTMTPEVFAEQMAYLAAQGYNIVPLREVPAILRGELPMPPKAVAITLDDGFRSTFEIAWPILKRHGFSATVFLYSDFAGLPEAMTWGQMKEMSASGLIDIQAQSKTHSNLSLRLAGESERAYAERVRDEIDSSTAEIERRLGGGSYAFAYPYGDANETVIEMIQHRGISVAFTVSAGGNAFYSYPLLLRRTMIFGDDSLADFRGKLAVFARHGER